MSLMAPTREAFFTELVDHLLRRESGNRRNDKRYGSEHRRGRQAVAGKRMRLDRLALTYPCRTNQRAESAIASDAGRGE